MSPRQIADDPGRQIRKPYLGPKGMRFPFDWTLQEIGLAFVVLVAGMFLLVLVVPAGLVIAGATWAGGRPIARLTSPDNPRKRFRLIAGLVTALCLLISLNPMTWISPLFFPLAVLAGLGLPIFVVRSKGKYLNWNRPFAYWMRLPFKVARGPRELPGHEVNVAPLLLGMDLTGPPTLEPTRIISPPALVIAPPVKRKPVRHQRGRHKLFERTEQGFRVGATEYRVEWTF